MKAHSSALKHSITSDYHYFNREPEADVIVQLKDLGIDLDIKNRKLSENMHNQNDKTSGHRGNSNNKMSFEIPKSYIQEIIDHHADCMESAMNLKAQFAEVAVKDFSRS